MNQEKSELTELAKPLFEYLAKNCHPYTAIVISRERVLVVETVQSIPMNCIRRDLEPINFVSENSNGKHMEN